jgi:hypothetical protein
MVATYQASDGSKSFVSLNSLARFHHGSRLSSSNGNFFGSISSVKVCEFPGFITYEACGLPKVVQFWLMRAEAQACPYRKLNPVGEREQPIVIENREIDLKFRRYLFLEGLTKLILIGWCAHLLSGAVLKAIEKDYLVQGTAWHDWKINKSGGSITLTPTKPEKPADTDTRPKPP